MQGNVSGNRLEAFAPIFYPKSHAVIGASANVRKFGGRFLASLLSFGYKGKLYAVNPQESEVLGLKTYARVSDIPGAVDSASIAVPARAVPEVVEECLAKGIKAVQVLSAGFSEAGEEGGRLESEIARTAARGLRVIGPNCFGVYCPGGGLTIMPGERLPRESGPVAFFSQSGGYAIRVPRRANGWGIRFSKIISYGNACDVNECDLLEYLCEDPETRIITGYIEGVKDGPRFFRLLQEVSRVKPVILWKGGLTRGGARAVHSHTASIGGEKAIWDTVFKQSGAIRVNSLDELLDTVLAFLHLPPIKERRVCVVGGGGGIGVAAADDCERAGLSVPLFSTGLQEKLKLIVPAAGGSARNPVDVGSPFPPPAVLEGVLETVLNEGNVDMVIVGELELARTDLMSSGTGRAQGDFGEPAQIPVAVKEKFGKPIIMVMPVESVGSDLLEFEGARRKLSDYYLEQGIPVFLTLERAAKALANIIGYYEYMDAL